MMIGKLFGAAAVLKKQTEIYQPKFGSLTLGYDGAFPSTALVDRQTLMGMLGETGIVRMYGQSADWLKFYLDGKTLWVASSPIGVNTNYNSLKNKLLFSGTRIITIANKRYKVRALSGLNNSTSEWNKLMYRVAADSPIAPADRWANYTTLALTQAAAGNGGTAIYSISPELNISNRVILRGRTTIAAEYGIGTTESFSDIGWRPVLELIDE